MSKPELKGKALYDTHQLVFLANEYPEKTMMELGELFLLTMLDINAAFWHAEDAGYMFISPADNQCKVDTVPDEWEFGPEVAQVKETLLYVLGKLAEKESDFTEEQMNLWFTGTPIQHQLCAIKDLINRGVIATYELTTTSEVKPSKKGLKKGKQTKIVEDTYKFYTLTENVGKEWGRSQFKDQSRLK